MLGPLRKRRKFSEGERARALAFVLVGVCSALMGYLAVLHLDRAALFESLNGYRRWIVAVSGFGGMLALFLSGDRLGQPGSKGAAKGAAGALWVTFIGALISGTMALPFYGTMFGPFVVFLTLIGAPLLIILWCFNFVSVPILLGIYQRERDTIFKHRDISEPMYPESLRIRRRGMFG